MRFTSKLDFGSFVLFIALFNYGSFTDASILVHVVTVVSHYGTPTYHVLSYTKVCTARL